MSDLDKVLAHIDADFDNAIARLFETLRIKSISTDPAYAGECRARAEWLVADLARWLRRIGARHARPPDRRRPRCARPAGPHVLFYGHYDVQPVDPLDLWHTDPFEPSIETQPDGETQIAARGASDDKGQLMTFVEACRAWKAVTGALPVARHDPARGRGGIGRQEPAAASSRRNKAELAADIALICDTDMWDADDAGDHHHAARPGRRGDRDHLRRPRPAFRHVRQRGAQPQPRARRASSPTCATPTARVAVPGFYDDVAGAARRRRATAGTSSASTRRTSSARSASRSRPARRAAPCSSRSGRARPRDQRHERRLHRRRLQDRDPGQGHRQDLVPPGRRPGPGQDPRGVPRLCPRPRARRLPRRLQRARRQPRGRLRHRPAGVPEAPRPR